MTAAETRPPKRAPRVALFELQEDTQAMLGEYFRQCGIDSLPVPQPTAEIFRRDKFEGCVVDLTEASAEEMVRAARTSASHSRIVIFGLCRSSAEIRLFSAYGINVLIQLPIVRQDALRAIHSARLLLLNELRRYVRIPLATNIRVQGSFRGIDATTVEISAGGMSVQLPPATKFAETDARITFTIPSLPPLSMAGVVCWRNTELHRIGIRFDPKAPEREAVKEWIEKYLGL